MQKENTPEEIKPDLKHDTMEYAASTDGDDTLDMDKENSEDDGITAEELDLLEKDDVDSQAEALNSAENDSLADEDNFIHEKTDVEELDITDEEDEADKEHHRK